MAFFFLMNKEHELRVVEGLDSFGAGKDVALGFKSSWNLENIGVWAGNKQEPIRIHTLYTWKERIPQRGPGNNATAGS